MEKIKFLTEQLGMILPISQSNEHNINLAACYQDTCIGSEDDAYSVSISTQIKPESK